MTDAIAAPLPFTPAEKEELRQRVLRGERLDLETARRVTISLRGERITAMALAAATGKRNKKSTKSKGMSDAELDADLDRFLNVAGSSSAGDAEGGDEESDAGLPGGDK